MRKLTLAAVLALLATAFASSAAAADVRLPDDTLCMVPCGYIYPRILMELEGGKEARPLNSGSPIAVDALLTYTFDPCQEGMGAPEAGKPIIVQFEFPRRPDWVEMKVEPEEVEIQILPQYLVPPDDPTSMMCEYRYEAPITIHASLVPGKTPVLRDGFENARLMVFAKSSESGLYKAAYGIREVRVVPENFVYQSSLGKAVVLESVDSLPHTLAPVSRSLLDNEITLTPRADVELWRAARFEVQSTNPATLNVALVDEHGRTLMSTGPRTALDGRILVNFTFFEPGRHSVLVHASPLANGPAFLAGTVSLPVVVGPFASGADAQAPAFPEAVRYPRDYRALVHEYVTEVAGNADAANPPSALFQYEKLIPFPVAPGANAMDIVVQLRTDNPGNVDTDRAVANLMFQILDPDEQVIQQGTVDFGNPSRRFAVNALPGEGLYHVRVVGTGLAAKTLAGASYTGALTVVYDSRPILPVTATGTLAGPASGATGEVAEARFGDFVHRLAAASDAAWEPQELTFTLERASAALAGRVRYSVTIHDEDGEAAYASGLREGDPGGFKATWTPPLPGLYAVTVELASAGAAGSEKFQRFVTQLPLTVGDRTAESFTLPSTFTFRDSGMLVPLTREDVPLAFQRVDLYDGARGLDASGTGVRVEIRDASGAPAQATTPGRYHVVVLGESLTGGSFSFEGDAAYDGPVVVANPRPFTPTTEAPPVEPGKFLPAPAPALLVVGLLLLGLAVRPRRRA